MQSHHFLVYGALNDMDSSLPPKERLNKLFDQGVATVNSNVPIARYFRSGEEMIRMANVYSEEKQYESAYVLLAKFITLFLQKLKSHPQYKNASPQAKAANKKSLKYALSKAESIKFILEEKYEIEHVKWKDEQEKMRALKEERLEQERLKSKHEKEQTEKALLDREKVQMEYFVEQQRRKQLESERQEIESKFSQNLVVGDDNFPLIPVDFAPPPNIDTSSPAVAHGSPPASHKPAATVPTIDRSCKPTPKPEIPVPVYTTGSVSTQVRANKYGLKTVISPHDLPVKFMQSVRHNTDRNVETCGILFGNLAQNQFIITHVLLPHQSGTSESCNTTREEDIWEFQELCNGICLGWIHTHPSQTAFLSSVDLHTHYPYQCLMSESVAIVCSGKFNETGYFMISPGRGMTEIGGCSKAGHHPHSTVPPLFESCDHVNVSSSHTVQLVDWRNK